MISRIRGGAVLFPVLAFPVVKIEAGSLNAKFGEGVGPSIVNQDVFDVWSETLVIFCIQVPAL